MIPPRSNLKVLGSGNKSFPAELIEENMSTGHLLRLEEDHESIFLWESENIFSRQLERTGQCWNEIAPILRVAADRLGDTPLLEHAPELMMTKTKRTYSNVWRDQKPPTLSLAWCSVYEDSVIK